MVARPCRDCPTLITTGVRCSACARAANTRDRNPVYDAAWRRLSARTIAAWLRDHGPWCPGDPPEHDAHVSFDLTLDHGGQAGIATRLLGRSQLRVMCRSWNAVLGRRR